MIGWLKQKSENTVTNPTLKGWLIKVGFKFDLANGYQVITIFIHNDGKIIFARRKLQ